MINRLYLLMPLAALIGCMQDRATEMVPSSLFKTPKPAPVIQRTNYAPGPAEMSQWVDFVGRKILAANPEIALMPSFASIGDPKPEIFHQGMTMVWVTSGLVSQCKTEPQLAAVLCQEFGKMVSEREAVADPRARDPEGMPPANVPIGQAGNYGSGADLTSFVEQVKYEKAHPRRRHPLPPPDPQVLARRYLEKAGYQKSDLDAAVPLLDAAEKNYLWERQIKGGQGNWTPGP